MDSRHILVDFDYWKKSHSLPSLRLPLLLTQILDIHFPLLYAVCSDIDYKALHGGSPRYLSSLVHVADVSGRPVLRSAGSNRLRIPPFKLSTIGGRAFPVAAAQFWNSLPDNVTSANSLSSFRQQLKHTLFQQSFPYIVM